jgi:hypothetical protein
MNSINPYNLRTCGTPTKTDKTIREFGSPESIRSDRSSIDNVTWRDAPILAPINDPNEIYDPYAIYYQRDTLEQIEQSKRIRASIPKIPNFGETKKRKVYKIENLRAFLLPSKQ